MNAYTWARAVGGATYHCIVGPTRTVDGKARAALCGARPSFNWLPHRRQREQNTCATCRELFGRRLAAAAEIDRHLDATDPELLRLRDVCDAIVENNRRGRRPRAGGAV